MLFFTIGADVIILQVKDSIIKISKCCHKDYVDTNRLIET